MSPGTKNSPRSDIIAIIAEADLPVTLELQRKVLAAMTVDLQLHIFYILSDENSNDDVAKSKSLRPTLTTTLNIMHLQTRQGMSIVE